MKTGDFWYELPPELIAQSPAEKRDHSRLMVLSKKDGSITHDYFYNLPKYLNPGDRLVLNNTRVLPARLIGTGRSGGRAELLLLEDKGMGRWECLAKPGRRIRPGDELCFGGGALRGVVEEAGDEGIRLVRFIHEGVFLERLEELGQTPLPPYITARLDDGERYQTVYAKSPGSAAAPTAGLHFTPGLFQAVEAGGVGISELTLHIGLGTFRPVKAENVEEHVMHSELFTVSSETAGAVNQAKGSGGRIVAVGTTVCRALESAAREDKTVCPASRRTDIFIRPGYEFKCVDCLVTNFHLPESTLLMLVSALAGRESVLRAYREAVEERYRFFSFGDAMLII